MTRALALKTPRPHAVLSTMLLLAASGSACSRGGFERLQLRLDVESSETSEAEPAARFILALDQPADIDIDIRWRTQDGTASGEVGGDQDFVGESDGSAVIPRNASLTTVEVALIDDALDEETEEFVFEILEADVHELLTDRAVATILDDDDAPTLTLNDAEADEGEPLAFVIDRSASSGRAIELTVQTVAGTATAGVDYSPPAQTVIIPAGSDPSEPVTFEVASLEDDVTCEDDETFTLHITDAVNATLAVDAALGIIREDDLPVIAISDPVGSEGDFLSYAVQLSFACDVNPARFDWRTFDGTAAQGFDYQPAAGSIAIPLGMTDASFTVTTFDDSFAEVRESLVVMVSDVRYAITDASTNSVAWLADDDAGTGIAKVVAGTSFTCALTAAGGVLCWGLDYQGVHGHDGYNAGDQPGEMGDDLRYVDLGAGFQAQKVANGHNVACALSLAGEVKCWGDNAYGQLGYGDTDTRGDQLGEMGDALPAVDLGTGRTAVDLAVGGVITCAVLDNGDVKCWGGDWRAIGYGDTRTRGDEPGEMGDDLPAIDLGTGVRARAVAATETRACAITQEDGVKCWGGSVGDEPSEMGDALPFVDFGAGRTAQAVAMGFWTTCALLDDDRVKCWGTNNEGQLGIGDTVDHPVDDPTLMGSNLPYVDLGTGRTALVVTAGYSRACALLDDGSIKCWGEGVGDEPGEMGDALAAADLGTGVNAIGVSATNGTTCAVITDGSVKCWGNNQKGQLGNGNRASVAADAGDAMPAVNLGSGRTVLSLNVGSWNDGGAGNFGFRCAVLDTRGVKCWGSNFRSRLGMTANLGDQPGEMGPSLQPIDLGTDAVAVDLVAGRHRACVLLDDGRVKCWGHSEDWMLVGGHRGDQPGEMGDALQPIALGTGRTAISVAASWYGSACAVLDDFTSKCWGSNVNGAAGTGASYVRAEAGDAMPTVDFGAGSSAAKIVGTASGFCALLNDARVKCWGRGGARLGLGDEENRGDDPDEMGDDLPFVDLGSAGAPADIVGGANHACALFADGLVKCWGNSPGHGLGVTSAVGNEPGEMAEALPFVDLGTGRSATRLFSGPSASATCALLDDGSLRCWGSNAGGQLGSGSTVDVGDDPIQMGDSLAPVSLGSGLAPLSVSLGSAHTCALLSNLQVKCWGQNSFGALGLGDTLTRGSTPGQMGDALPFADLVP